MARDTTTGAVLEKMIIPALEQGGYHYWKQQYVGERPGGRKHMVDFLVWKEGSNPILVSMKYQDTPGTAEQKVPFEVICLMKAIKDNETYEKAYIVMGGSGWTLRDFYVEGGLKEYIVNSENVHLLKLEDFIRLANHGNL